MQRVLYFAYGSNLLMERLVARVGRVQTVSPHTLNGYDLVFNRYGYADIVPNPDASVDGILYALTPEQLKELDRYELLYARNHFLANINGTTEICCVYIGTGVRSPYSIIRDKPELSYLNYILEGASKHGLVGLVNKLTSYKKANYKLKKIKQY